MTAQVSWEIANGRPFPDGMDACHTCDNPTCVRPDHLFPGTATDNIRDAVAKGRLVPHNKGKEICHRGHTLSGENLRVDKGGRKGRRCLACARIHAATARQVARAKREAARG